MANYNSIEEIVAGVENATQLVSSTKYLVRDSGKIYTVTDGALAEVAGELSASLFTEHGVDTIPDGALLMALTAPEVLCWTNADELPVLTATVQGAPTGAHDVISDNIPVGHSSIFGLESLEADSSENSTFFLSFDGGMWMTYTGGKWSASDVGMTTAELLAVPISAWNTMINSARNMRLKATLDGLDTVTQVKFNFNNDPSVVGGLTWNTIQNKFTWNNTIDYTWKYLKGV